MISKRRTSPWLESPKLEQAKLESPKLEPPKLESNLEFDLAAQWRGMPQTELGTAHVTARGLPRTVKSLADPPLIC